MNLKNNFQPYAKNKVWIDRTWCAVCSCNRGCAIHHIYGRKGQHNGSIYNGIMLCDTCHRQADCYNTHTTGDPRKIKLLYIAIKYIAKSDYKRIQKDIFFLNSVKADFDEAMKMINVV